MENPFCYIPFIAKKLKEADKNTKEYRKQLKEACRDSLFYSKLTECVITDRDNKKTKPFRKQLSNDTRMLIFFVRVGVIAAIIGAIGAIFFRDSAFGRNAMYIFAAALVTLPFVIGYIVHSNKLTVKMAEVYLEDYKLPDERFTDQRIEELVLIRASTKDFIHTSELENDIPCGCYNCVSRFGSSQLKTVEMSNEYACPFCGKTTVISERSGHEITDELLQDLHDYWIDD